MSAETLPVAALQPWIRLNDVDFSDNAGAVARLSPERGLGLVAQRDLCCGTDAENHTLVLRIPRKLVLCHETVDEYAKVDGKLKQLRNAVGRRDARQQILLFLLTQLLISRSPPPSSSHPQHHHLVPTPWSSYLAFLATNPPIPTLWSDAERQILTGSSLDFALEFKLAALEQEYSRVQAAAVDLPFWQDVIDPPPPCPPPAPGTDGAPSAPAGPNPAVITLRDWVLLDAWFRSRSLEIPGLGQSMVPVLDMANHSPFSNAYYEAFTMASDSPSPPDDCVVIRLRPGTKLAPGDELTICYGQKPPAEMLFSYGFIDEDACPPAIVVQFPLAPLTDDPLARFKLRAFRGPPLMAVALYQSEPDDEDGCGSNGGGREGTQITVESPFAHLAVLNEDDGLSFRLLRENGREHGEDELRVFWGEDDVTDRTDDFESLIAEHPLEPVFRLRVATVLQDTLLSQMESMDGAPNADAVKAQVQEGLARRACAKEALAYRELERSLLEQAVAVLEAQKDELAADEQVTAYLEDMEKQGEEAQATDAAGRKDPEKGDGNYDEDEFS